MSTLIADQARWTARAIGPRREEAVRPAERVQPRPGDESTIPGLEARGGEQTLDEVLAGTWEGLTAHAVVECPMCRGPMAPVYGAQSLPIGGRCECCLSSLS